MSLDIPSKIEHDIQQFAQQEQWLSFAAPSRTS